MVKSRAVLIDLVSGLVANYVRKYEANGRERRYVIEYKDANAKGIMGKTKKLPSTIPPEGMLEFAGVKLLGGRPWVVVFSYGRDDLYPPLLQSQLNLHYGEVVRKLDELSISTETKQEAIEARQRIMDRGEQETAKKLKELQKEVGSRRRPERGFLGMNIGEE